MNSECESLLSGRLKAEVGHNGRTLDAKPLFPVREDGRRLSIDTGKRRVQQGWIEEKLRKPVNILTRCR